MTTIIDRIMSNAKESELEVALAITGVVALATVFYSFFRTVDSSGLSPAMEEEETHKIMRKILGKLQLEAPRLMKNAQDSRQKIEQQGGDIDDKTLMKDFILPNFKAILKDIQDKELEDNNVDEDDLEEACTTYVEEGDEELIEIYKKIRALHRTFGGDEDDENEDAGAHGGATVEMSVDEVVQLMAELLKAVLQATDKFCAKFIDENGKPRTQAHMEVFHMGQMELVTK
ncbi:hypothetical protein B484DRAFT_480506 [Ochromonadaceae sp. CCMP2298]|nr:hypothetical protein B484DRAFT_480506 [Ochromonadaceae sp. CCMP2298]